MLYTIPYKTKTLLTALLITTLTSSIISLNSYAKDEEKEEGKNGRITKAQLLNKLKNLKKDEYVDGYIINGSDIIAIIKESDVDIKIRLSIIEGGLDFSKLPEVNGKREVNNKVEILNSEVESSTGTSDANQGELSLYTEQNYFNKNIIFNSTTFNVKVEFRDTTCNDWVDFRNATFNEYADFHQTKFRRGANFSEAIFNAWVSFEDAIFNLGTSFLDSTFRQSATFGRATFNEHAYFNKATFSESAIFEDATFNHNVNFPTTTFNGWANFKDATFLGDADFSFTTFNQNAEFIRTNFIGNGDFEDATFIRNANFEHATFSGNAYFLEVIFSGDVSFMRVTFSREALFWDVIFGKKADFSYATFNRKGSFSNSTFSEEANFRNTIFDKLAFFRDAKFFGELRLDGALFREYANFRDTKIRRLNYKNVSNTVVIGARIDLRGAWITEANFENIVFEKDVDFFDAEFGKLIKEDDNIINPATVFRFVTFESDVFFIKAKFYGRTALENVNFKREANFTNAEFIWNQDKAANAFSLSYLNFKNLILNFGQLPKPENWVRNSNDRIKSFVDLAEEQEKKEEPIKGKELQPLSEVLSGLEATFRKENRLDDRNKAYYHMKIFELEEKIKNKPFWGLTTWERWEWILWGWSSGYGTNIWRVLLIYLFSFLFFAVVYYSDIGDIIREKTEESKADSEFKLRLLNFPWNFIKSGEIKNKELIDFFTSLRFSKVLIFKVGRRDAVASGKLMTKIVWGEWVFGYYLLALLVITLKNTVPIINSLVTSVF